MGLSDSGYEQHLADLATAWIADHPAEAVSVLTEAGALVQFSDCGYCAGRQDCRFVDSDGIETGAPDECVPVYRLEPDTGMET